MKKSLLILTISFFAVILISCAPEATEDSPFNPGPVAFACSITWDYDDKECIEAYDVNDINILSELMTRCSNFIIHSLVFDHMMNPDGTWKNCPSTDVVLTCDERIKYHDIPIKAYYYGDYYRGISCANVESFITYF
jgi:hypothetical protein